MTDDVILERAGGIAVITLNRPNALNALSTSVMRALDGVLDQLEADRALRAVIVTAQGRAFSAGGDLLEFNSQLQNDPRQLIETLGYNQRVFAKLESLPVPVIGAVNGTAVAGGTRAPSVLRCSGRFGRRQARRRSREIRGGPGRRRHCSPVSEDTGQSRDAAFFQRELVLGARAFGVGPHQRSRARAAASYARQGHRVAVFPAKPGSACADQGPRARLFQCARL